MAMKGFCFNKYSQFTPTHSSLEMDENRDTLTVFINCYQGAEKP